MAVFTAKLTHVRLNLSPFSTQQMADLGDFMIQTKFSRLDQAMDSTDSPAPALNTQYARRKIRYNRAPLRDWNWRGATRRAIKVKSANEERVVIGPVNSQADMIMTVQRRKKEQWSDSPRDTEALHAYVKQMLQAHRIVSVVRVMKKTA